MESPSINKGRRALHTDDNMVRYANMESIPQFQETVAHEPGMLNEHDADWLATFNILPDTPNQTHFINTLNELNQQGSTDLRSLSPEASVEHDAIMQARHDFFALVGLGETMAKKARYSPALPRPELFIILQRELYMLGLDGPGITKKLPYGVLGRDGTRIKRNFEVLQELGLKPLQIINRFPNILGHSEEAIQAKVRCLEELGLKPVRVINRFPNILGHSEEAIQAKVRCLEELGLKPVRVINRFPTILGLAEKTIQSKVRCLEELGLKPVQLINRSPNILGHSEEAIQAKVRCLEDLGLKPVRVINRSPSILGLAEATIQAKFAFFQRTAELLKWEYTAEILLNTQPNLLCVSLRKLQIHRRLLARNVISASRNCPPGQIGNASFKPLEAYMIVLADMNEGEQFSLEELARQAFQVQQSLAQAPRRATVKTIAESSNKTLGSRVCRMYLEYAKT